MGEELGEQLRQERSSRGKTLVISVVIVLAMLSTAGARQAWRPDGHQGVAASVGSMVGALFGSTFGDGYRQILAKDAPAMVKAPA